MSFLAPLFALGAIAIAAPIIFHLIRRTSREKFRFSSLMFLQATPPRMTRQSRLENIFLLILRCLVLALLALGFARPFIQKQMGSDANSGAGRRLAILLDVSASMRQEGLWTTAKARVESILKTVTPADSVAIFSFDHTARPLFSFEEWSAVAANDRVPLASKRVAELQPGWHSTHLGNALLTAIDAVEDSAGRDPSKPVAAERKVVVITDLQDGARLDGLQGFEWPRGIEVDLQALKPARVSNAGLHLVGDSDERERNLTETEVRVRVSNAATSRREQFQVGWVKPGEKTFAGTPVDVYVPPGQSRVATIPITAAAGPALEELRLRGDDEEFDNLAFHAPPKAEQIRVLYLGSEAPTDHTQPLYYIQRAFLETRRLKVEVLARPGTAPLSPAEIGGATMLIAAGALPPEGVKSAREFLESGRTGLFALKDAESVKTLASLLGLGALESQETGGRESYALLGQIDFQHPIFAPFADPRFSDFTKIHFWKYRTLDPADIKGARVLARFDKGGPALLEVPVGKGTLLVLTSGWHPADSQLALSSKFVPIIYSMLELSGAIRAQLAQYVVGDALSLTGTNGSRTVALRTPSGQEHQVTGNQRFSATDQPGVYVGTIQTAANGAGSVSSSEPIRVAVNLDPAESRTAQLPIEILERLGVPLKPPTAADVKREAEKKERLHATELEQRQKLWRWLIVGALIFLLLETFVAGRLTSRVSMAG